ncbi:putative secreted protein [Wickerhamomyces ciferrii]|uniref:Secreted protein n=1 Tax=Wickerhamomyces ciferrii (strain ATCC 14091 / BCRC 22168 / CBS 111 / JCM 3599 / NBRC 0793 / NRRL Y-1031 F-60-10) TaxID=1206466 RepID=K0KLA4_WICCF|nr:uncharacterized protein BN7_1427 [Wickerhamomyces ciferrii]CCH41888.1 putative secreted protein [Wickerhamomyces ciferrii]
MKLLESLKVSWFILSISCLLFQLSNTSSVSQAQNQKVSKLDDSHISSTNEPLTIYNSMKEDSNNLKKLEVQDDDEHDSLKKRSNNKETKDTKELEDSKLNYSLEPQVSNQRDPNSNVVTRSQIDFHNFNQETLSQISRSSLLPPDDSCKILTTTELETPEHEELMNQEVCLICFESYSDSHENLVKLPCAHKFHHRCFIKTGRTNGNRTDVERPSMKCCVCQLSLIKYHQYLVDHKLDPKQVEFINK